MPRDEPPLRLTRRGVLSLGALGVASIAGAYAVAGRAGAKGTGTVPPELHVSPVPVDRTALQARTRIGTARYVYEIGAAPSTYYVEPDFGRRLDRWLALHTQHVGPAPDAIFSYGAWAPGASASWHRSGQALDVSRLRRSGRDLVSARYDQWRDAPAGELKGRLTAYWRLAAGLHHEFADVLTYLYGADHANHIHVDIGRFGPEQPRLIPRSRVQVQAVQAMCRYVWGRSEVQLTGELDAVTRDTTTRILRDHAGAGELTDGREAWQAFLVATMRQT